MGSGLQEIARAFDTRAVTYARSVWHRACAERLVELCQLPPGSRVLDAATGTGFAALAAGRTVGADGRVVAVDISPGMLEQARIAVAASGLTNIELVESDATSLAQYAARSFDAVTCACGLLYMPVQAALEEWRRLLQPGGLLGFATMRAGSPDPGRLFRDCAAEFGVSLRDPSAPLGTPSASSAALEQAGFEAVEIVSETVDFPPEDLAVAWESNLKSPAAADVHRLSPPALQAFEQRYREALARQAADDPESLSRGHVLYVTARR